MIILTSVQISPSKESAIVKMECKMSKLNAIALLKFFLKIMPNLAFHLFHTHFDRKKGILTLVRMGVKFEIYSR